MKAHIPSQIFLTTALSMTIATASPWSTRTGENPEGPGMAMDIHHDGSPAARLPGMAMDIHHDGSPAARLIYGEGQMKPFLHVFGTEGEMLTNPGLDEDGEEVGRFPHHRGIFIGWNRIRSELGSDDLWHFRQNEWMDVTEVRETAVTDDYAEIALDVVWQSSKEDDDGDRALINETRTLRFSKPDGGDHLVVDAKFELTAARELTLGGDLQHAGVHFRAHRDVDQRSGETIYMWYPDVAPGGGRIINPDMRWCRFFYPIGERWYSTIQLNAPGNPTEELSWRDYGRFGFFFKREMEQGDSLTLNYRFITSPVAAPGEDGYGEAVENQMRELSSERYESYAAEF